MVRKQLLKSLENATPGYIIKANDDGVPEYVPEIIPGNLPYELITSDQTIAVGNMYGVQCTTNKIILTLSDGLNEGETLTVRKIDDTDNEIIINCLALINGYSSIELSMQEESYDLYWTGSTFIIK